jgi:hypothetical protein
MVEDLSHITRHQKAVHQLTRQSQKKAHIERLSVIFEWRFHTQATRASLSRFSGRGIVRG